VASQSCAGGRAGAVLAQYYLLALPSFRPVLTGTAVNAQPSRLHGETPTVYHFLQAQW
jgi:hypothetical protein